MLKGRLATYPGQVRLIVHEPIDTHGLVDADPAAARAFAARVRDVIAPAAESAEWPSDPQWLAGTPV